MIAFRRKAAWLSAAAIALVGAERLRAQADLSEIQIAMEGNLITNETWKKEALETTYRDLFAALKDMGVGSLSVGEGRMENLHAPAYNMPVFVTYQMPSGYLQPDKAAAFTRIMQQYRSSRNIAADKLALLVREPCWSDPAFLEKYRGGFKAAIDLARPKGLVFAWFDAEPGLGRMKQSADFCYSQHCLAGFRRWLRTQYGSIAQLNQTWGTDHESFDTVVPLTWKEIGPHFALRKSYAPWKDHRAHMDEVFAGFYGALRKIAAVPAGPMMCQYPTSGTGFDYYRLSKAVDFIDHQNYYDTGDLAALVRSFPGYRLRMTEIENRPDYDAYFAWKRICHGYNGIWVYRLRDYISRDTGRPTDLYGQVRPLLREISRGIGKQIQLMKLDDCGIAVLYSQDSIHIRWAQDVTGSWYTDSGTAQYLSCRSTRSREGWNHLLEDLGWQYRYVAPEQVEAGELEKFKVLILPEAEALSDNTLRRIRRFSEGKGLVLADLLCGRFDEHGRLRDQPVLAKGFGPGQPVVLSRRLEEYTPGRYSVQEDPFSEKVAAVLASARLAPALRVQTPVEPGGRKVPLEVVHYTGEGGIHLFAVSRNYTHRATPFETRPEYQGRCPKIPADAAVPAAFNVPGEVYDVRAGRHLGEAKAVTSLAVNHRLPTILAVLPEKIAGIDLSLPETADRGQKLSVEVALRAASPVKGRRVIRLDFIHEGGAEAYDDARNLVAADGKAACTIDPAFTGIAWKISSRPGLWKAIATDVLTGVRAEKAFTFKEIAPEK